MATLKPTATSTSTSMVLAPLSTRMAPRYAAVADLPQVHADQDGIEGVGKGAQHLVMGAVVRGQAVHLGGDIPGLLHAEGDEKALVGTLEPEQELRPAGMVISQHTERVDSQHGSLLSAGYPSGGVYAYLDTKYTISQHVNIHESAAQEPRGCAVSAGEVCAWHRSTGQSRGAPEPPPRYRRSSSSRRRSRRCRAAWVARISRSSSSPGHRALQLTQALDLGLVQVVDDDGDEEVDHHEGPEDHEADEVHPGHRVQLHGGIHYLGPALQGNDVEQGEHRYAQVAPVLRVVLVEQLVAP